MRPDRGRHVGLGLLRERARLSGGSVQVDSVRERGTTLTLRLPRPVSAVIAGVPLLTPEPEQARRRTDRFVLS